MDAVQESIEKFVSYFLLPAFVPSFYRSNLRARRRHANATGTASETGNWTRKIDGPAARVGSDARHPGELFSVYSDGPRSCGGRPRVEHDCPSAAQAGQAGEDVCRHPPGYRSPRWAKRGRSPPRPPKLRNAVPPTDPLAPR